MVSAIQVPSGCRGAARRRCCRGRPGRPAAVARPGGRPTRRRPGQGVPSASRWTAGRSELLRGEQPPGPRDGDRLGGLPGQPADRDVVDQRLPAAEPQRASADMLRPGRRSCTSANGSPRSSSLTGPAPCGPPRPRGPPGLRPARRRRAWVRPPRSARSAGPSGSTVTTTPRLSPSSAAGGRLEVEPHPDGGGRRSGCRAVPERGRGRPADRRDPRQPNEPGRRVGELMPRSVPVTGAGCGCSLGPAPARARGQPSTQSIRSISIGRWLMPKGSFSHGSSGRWRGRRRSPGRHGRWRSRGVPRRSTGCRSG